jgi:predicted NBD/HSP70 family sugar kinase
VGGTRIAGKQIDPYQRHSEPGHVIIQEDGRHFDLCGQDGCVSAYISGTAFPQVYGVSPEDCEDPGIWEDYANKLALVINNVVAMWGPDVIVLGGSMSKKFEDFFREPLLHVVSEHPLFEIPPVVLNELGDKSGIFGGFSYLSQQ